MFDIPFLDDNGSNFAFWQFRVRMVLELRDLWVLVDGSKAKPDEKADATGYADWISKDREARAQITLTLKDEPLNSVLFATTAKECWDKLSERYEGKGEQKIVYLIDEVFRSTLSESEPLEPQINALIRAANTISNLGLTLDDKLLAFALISSLPSSFSTLKTILSTTKPTDLTVEYIKSQVILDEQRRVRESGAGATAYFAKAAKKGKKKDNQSDGQKKKKCTHCKKLGHDVGECRKLKKEKEEEAAKAKTDSAPKPKAADASAKIAVAEDSDSDHDPVRLFMSQGLPAQGDLQRQWIVDSGASRTMCSNREWFTHFIPLTSPINIVLGDNSTILGTGVGRIPVQMKAKGQWNHAILRDVLYVPELHGNLLSVPQLARRGADVRFTEGGCQVYDQHGTLACEGSLRGNLYLMPIRVVAAESACVAITQVDTFPTDGGSLPFVESALSVHTTTSKADIHTWHRRLGHLHIDAILDMTKKGMVRGMEIIGTSSHTPNPCEACLKGKQTRAEIQKSTESRAAETLGRIFSDVCGPLPTCSHRGFSYFVTWIDDASCKVFVAGMREKSEVFSHLKAFVTRAELGTGMSLKILRSDGGGEYTAHAVQTYLSEKGVQHEVTTPDTPQHNGVAERMNRTLLDKVRSMLQDAALPESYWYDALEYAALLHNVTPTRALDGITPEESWSGNKPDVSRLRVFGARAFVHIPEKQRSKLAARSLTCTFLGYARNRHAYRLVHRPSKRFFESRDVVFDEGGTEKRYERIIFEPNDTADVNGSTPSGNPQSVDSAASPAKPASESKSEQEIEGLLTPPPVSAPATGRPKRATRTPTRDDDPRYTISSYGRKRPEHAKSAHLTDADPRTYREAMSRPDAAEWEVACQAEMRSFEHMSVYEVVPRPKGKNVVGSKWVFRIKRGPDGAILKYKARVVAQGFTQIEGVDYDETFAPVAKLASLHTILALAAELDLEIHQMDVKSAYLNGELKEEIYMKPPPGFDVPDGMVLKLVKALYGTKQGGRVWYENIRNTLNSMGYERTEADHAVFTRVRSGALSILALYVDDITMACKSLEVINQDKEQLKKHYEMTDLGEIAWKLGVHVMRDRRAGWIALSQEKYALEILERFGKSDVRPISTPTLANEHLTKIDSPEVDVQQYQRAVGALMYLMLGTRPDLAYTVAALGRHSACPGKEHERALDRAFRYLRATSHWKLVFQRGTPNGAILKGFVDADWASDVNDRKSTSGFVFMLAGGAISWGSKKQSAVALSSTEAEYIAAAHAAKEVVWLRRLLTELKQKVGEPTILSMDNQSAIAIARNPEFHDRSKHIEIWHHFLRQKIDENELDLVFVPTGDQVADVLTKGLVREKHERFADAMGIRRVG
jgi:hypothetical protein